MKSTVYAALLSDRFRPVLREVREYLLNGREEVWSEGALGEHEPAPRDPRLQESDDRPVEAELVERRTRISDEVDHLAQGVRVPCHLAEDFGFHWRE